MAKRKTNENGVNKSAMVREILDKDAHTPVKDIVATLEKQGIEVKPNLVYLIKSKRSNRKRKQKRQQAMETSGKVSSGNPIDLILKVKKLAGESGGIKNLKKLVDVLAD